MSIKRVLLWTTVLIGGLLAIGLLITALSPASARLNARGNGAFENGDYMGALTNYILAQGMDPNSAEAYYNAANALYRQEQYGEAIAQIDRALYSAENDLITNSYFNLGNSFYNATDLAGAIAAYKEALRLNPNDLDAKYNLELALQMQEQQEQEQQDEEQNEDGGGESDESQSEEQKDGESEQDQEQQEGEDGQEQQDQQDQSGESDQSEQGEGDQQNQDGSQGEDQQQQEGQDEGESQAQSEGEGQPSDEQDGQPGDKPGEGQADPSEQIADALQQGRLTEEEAQQILAAIAGNSETLQERLDAIFMVPGPPPTQDW
jgi:Ca-activated chloride channel family protein